MYSDGYEATHGGDALPTVEIVVESQAPHDVVVYQVPDDVLDAGRDAYRDALVQVARCRERDEWHGVAGGKELVFSLPKWAVRGDDDYLDGLEET
jgi:hypothetical protein